MLSQPDPARIGAVSSPLDSHDTRRAKLAEALARTAQEDRAGFREVYTLSSAKLFGICLRICGERQAAEDVLQEVYLTVWKRAAGYEPGRASPITWLATIARNRAIDWRREHPAGRAAPLENAHNAADASPRQDDRLADLQEEARLHACLDTLEHRQRDAIRTAFFGGRTYAELAAHADVPLGTMKSWVRRGLLRLRECLGDDG